MSNPALSDTATYLRNMAALWKNDARLALVIDNLPDEAVFPVEASKSGPATLAMPTPTGQTIWLHSRYDPATEARKGIEGIDVTKGFCFVVCGLGLGYHVRALFEKLRGDALIIVAEPSLPLIRTALEHTDLSDVIGSGRCVFLTQDNTNHIHTQLQGHSTLMMLGTQIVPHRPSQQIAGEFHTKMAAMLSDYASYSRMSLMTLVGNSRITASNIAHNLPTYVATPPIDILRDRFRGYPGIVIAAGPSLHRNIHLLSDLGDRAVMCAVQTIFRTLLERGIVPDFVTSLDYHELSRRYFENIPDFRGVHLIAEPKATPWVVDLYRGPISLLENPFARQCLGDDLARRGGLHAGATVAHLAFYLLEYLGCDPIVFVGQDLAFTDHCYYAPGASAHNAWRPELNRFCSIESKEWERIIRARQLLRQVTDIHGQPLYTNEHMFSYLQQFESDFARCAAKVIDASEGGVLKRGVETVPLAEAARRYCTRPIPAELRAYRSSTKWYEPTMLPIARERLVHRREELIAFRDLCRDTVELLDRLGTLTDRPSEFNRLVARADEMRTRVRDHQNIYQMVSMVSQLAEFLRFTADRHIRADDPSGPDRAKRQLARDGDFIRNLLDGCDVLDRILAEAIERFDKTIEEHRVS